MLVTHISSSKGGLALAFIRFRHQIIHLMPLSDYIHHVTRFGVLPHMIIIFNGHIHWKRNFVALTASTTVYISVQEVSSPSSWWEKWLQLGVTKHITPHSIFERVKRVPIFIENSDISKHVRLNVYTSYVMIVSNKSVNRVSAKTKISIISEQNTHQGTFHTQCYRFFCDNSNGDDSYLVSLSLNMKRLNVPLQLQREKTIITNQ